MFLIIVGTGAMGQVIRECAKEDKTFGKIEFVEPLDNNWPEEKADLIIDFSHPKAVRGIYEYCLIHKGGIPVVIGTTGHAKEEEQLIKMLEKICPVLRKSNFSRGIEIINDLLPQIRKKLSMADIIVEEIHHTKKSDAPSGTAKVFCQSLGKDNSESISIRMGNVAGIHKIYFALDDEIIEISHTAYSKKIFAKGALESGKKLVEKARTVL